MVLNVAILVWLSVKRSVQRVNRNHIIDEHLEEIFERLVLLICWHEVALVCQVIIRIC